MICSFPGGYGRTKLPEFTHPDWHPREELFKDEQARVLVPKKAPKMEWVNFKADEFLNVT